MNLFDTLCHLSNEKFKNNLNNIILEAKKYKVNYFISPASIINDWDIIINQHKLFNNIYIALGIHPWFVNNHLKDEIHYKLNTYLKNNTTSLVGEIGLDFYNKNLNNQEIKNQYELFELQINIANKFKRPIILHNRKSISECIKILIQNKIFLNGIFHAFSGSKEQAKQILNLGYKIGIGSAIMLENSYKIQNTLKYLPLDGFVLETDSPFMFKNNNNHPKNTYKIAQKVSYIKNINIEEVIINTTNNAFEIVNFNN